MACSASLAKSLSSLKKILVKAAPISLSVEGPANIKGPTTVSDPRCQQILEELQRLQKDFSEQVVEKSQGSDRKVFLKTLNDIFTLTSYLRNADRLQSRSAKITRRILIAQQTQFNFLFNKLQTLWKTLKEEAQQYSAKEMGTVLDRFATRVQLISNLVEKVDFLKTRAAGSEKKLVKAQMDDLSQALEDLGMNSLESGDSHQASEELAMHPLSDPSEDTHSEDQRLIQEFLAELDAPIKATAILKVAQVADGIPPFVVINTAPEKSVSDQMNILRYQDPEYAKDSEDESELVEEFVFQLHALHNKGGETYKTLLDARRVISQFCEFYPVFKLSDFKVFDTNGKEFSGDPTPGIQQTIPLG
jgi:hypothetical protein